MPLSDTTDIAQELIDTVVDFLHDDQASLFSSSLVARNWVPATRYHLFERIRIHHFFTRAVDSRYSMHDTARQFLDICSSPFCTILPFIRDVVLNVETPFESQEVLLKQLVDVFAQAPVTKLVFVDHTKFKPTMEPISLIWLGPRFSGLRHLSYNALDRFALDTLALVAHFPELQSLSLCSSTKNAARTAFTQSKPYPSLAPASFAHLRTLSLRLFSHQSQEFMAWLRTGGDHIRLETLDLVVFHAYHNGWGPIAALNAFLSANGTELREFGFRLRYEDDHNVELPILLSHDDDDELDLGGLTNLRSLRLGSHNVEAICTTLSSLPPDLHTLKTFELLFREWIHYEAHPCPCNPRLLVREFADVMRRDQFASLTAFTILIPEIFGDGWKDGLKQFFPRWKDTDVLRLRSLDAFQSSFDTWESIKDTLL
ncbi:hypothetical protein MSAN_01580300 [Mycena sanguinolenta]|uniref:Uncharacterized protein n=1 Tax=Mycena sanguinolenta TaxID=230812 RepID=A0A8H6Y3G3_9AGAR|nr:hypothetical protein MSAN_01580300 [Mycena sanguinolenta]